MIVRVSLANLVGQILAVACSDHVAGRVESKIPGWQRNRSCDRFRIARWNLNYQPAGLAERDLLKLRGNEFDMPVR